MGYNGSNRRGAKSSMFKKSSYKSGSNMLFGKKGIFTGMFDVGSAITKDVIKEIPKENIKEEKLISDNDSSENKVIYIILIIIISCVFIFFPLLGTIITLLLFGAFLKK